MVDKSIMLQMNKTELEKGIDIEKQLLECGETLLDILKEMRDLSNKQDRLYIRKCEYYRKFHEIEKTRTEFYTEMERKYGEQSRTC